MDLRFGQAAASVLNARQGRWQERKRAWVALGIQSKIGRTEDGLVFGRWTNCRISWRAAKPNGSPGGSSKKQQPTSCGNRTRRQRRRSGGAGVPPPGEIEISTKPAGRYPGPASAVPRPRCELALPMVQPAGRRDLDPFAGGSSCAGSSPSAERAYHGFDLRPEQIEANAAQAEAILTAESDAPVVPALRRWPGPPGRRRGRRGRLRVRLPAARRSGGNTAPTRATFRTWRGRDFLTAYRAIIASLRMARGRIASPVSWSARCATRLVLYRDFVGETVAAFQAAGLGFYNEAILVMQVMGSAAGARQQTVQRHTAEQTHQGTSWFSSRATRARDGSLPGRGGGGRSHPG